ncbi:MAG: DUF2274 domain-containing protein [Hyphomonadaceae bacterium]|nr:DUF2274 domain-containing protein [Hyphomonadaceae bacterium]
MSLRLSQLPDRTPVRMTIALDPELATALGDYAEIYERTYGKTEKPEALVPAMLETFLGSDAGFKRARKALSNNARTGD